MENVIVRRVSFLFLDRLIRHVETSDDRLVLRELALLRLLKLSCRSWLQQIPRVCLLSCLRQLRGECAAFELCLQSLPSSLLSLFGKLASLLVKSLVGVWTSLSRKLKRLGIQLWLERQVSILFA